MCGLPSLAAYGFDPASTAVTVKETEGNATDVDFVATPVYSHIYTAGSLMIGIPVNLGGLSSKNPQSMKVVRS